MNTRNVPVYILPYLKVVKIWFNNMPLYPNLMYSSSSSAKYHGGFIKSFLFDGEFDVEKNSFRKVPTRILELDGRN